MHAFLFLLLLGDGARADVPPPKAEVVPRRYQPPPPPPAAPLAKPKKETAAERKKRLAEEKRTRKLLEALSGKDGQQMGLIGVLRSGDSTGSSIFGSGDLSALPPPPPPANDREAIHRVVQAHTSSVKYCYEKELAQKPELAGRVTTRIKIDDTGTVSEATIASSTLGDANVEGCMLQQIRNWKFPAKATTVIYPFRFENGG